MSSELSVAVQSLGKRYKILPPGMRPSTLSESVLAAVTGRGPKKLDFWALRDVSFQVSQGEVVGLIGHNGAGKSTLLKMLSRIAEPTEGRIDLYGRVGSLLEVGTGFHPELTGRENIFMNGTILGMSRREIEERFDAIVAFAGPRVEQLLETPVKRYSSGMALRLAFAVAANLEPNILIVDEVLAVGDSEFQKKCLGKMHDIASSGRTVFFVSHNLAAVTALCTRGLLLKGGQVVADGPVGEVAAIYQQQTRAVVAADGDLTKAVRSGSGAAQFTQLALKALSPDGEALPLLVTGGTLVVEAQLEARQRVSELVATMTIRDTNTYPLVDTTTAASQRRLTLDPGEHGRVRFTLPELLLKPGLYSLSLWLGRPDTEEMDSIEHAAVLEVAVDLASAQSGSAAAGPYACRYSAELIPIGESALLAA